MSTLERKQWLLHHVKRKPKKCATVSESRRNLQLSARESRRNWTYDYELDDHDGMAQDVCKPFFLTTLGYKPSNDRAIQSILKCTSGGMARHVDKRGKHDPSNKIKEEIKSHVELFYPEISHYRREHAPKGQTGDTFLVILISHIYTVIL